MRILIVLIIAAALGWLWWSGFRKAPAEGGPTSAVGATPAQTQAKASIVGQWRAGSKYSYQFRDNGSYVATLRQEINAGEVVAEVSARYRGKWQMSGQQVTMRPEAVEGVTVLQARAAAGAIFVDRAKEDSAVNKVRSELPGQMMRDGASGESVFLVDVADARWLKGQLDGQPLSLERVR